MIDIHSLTLEWIEKVARASRNADKILVEKVIRAFYLLELLKQSDLDFLFKGGTSLMLLMQQAKRLSIDIDIIIPGNKDKLTDHLDSVIKQSDFLEYIENERTVDTGIEKAHYKFYYKPVTNTRASKEYILLDILFEQSPYADHIIEHPIKSPFLRTKDEPTLVTVPSFEAILGDKMTAFAPNTTGIPYGKGKVTEIIKQLYDVGNLFDHISTVQPVAKIFHTVAKAELAYRSLNQKPEDVLRDTWQTALLITTRGKEGKGDFQELQQGIQNIRNFIFSENFHIERAMVHAAKAAYLAALVLHKENEIKRFGDPEEITDWQIKKPLSTRLNKFKKTNPEVFFYWYQVGMLMNS